MGVVGDERVQFGIIIPELSILSEPMHKFVSDTAEGVFFAIRTHLSSGSCVFDHPFTRGEVDSEFNLPSGHVKDLKLALDTK